MRNNRLFTAVLTALVLSVLAYFAADIPFFTWREPLERASLRSVNDGEPLSFSYSGDALTLHGAGENVTVYGLTLGGMAEISGGSASSFPEDSLGTIAAVRQAYQADTNNDGIPHQSGAPPCQTWTNRPSQSQTPGCSKLPLQSSLTVILYTVLQQMKPSVCFVCLYCCLPSKKEELTTFSLIASLLCLFSQCHYLNDIAV